MTGTNRVDEHRDAVFITHANPEDNAFCRWLGAKLTALGYKVWADVVIIRGGEYWQRKLEQALRHRAWKVCLLAPRAECRSRASETRFRSLT
jgi:TIR domain